mgnify:CR=1 FL=1
MPSGGASVRESGSKRLMAKAVALFLVSFLVILGIVGYLFFHDFDQRTVRSKLAEAADSARTLASALYREIAPSGTFDFVRIVERRAALAQTIDQYTSQLKYVQYVDVLDDAGRLIFRRRLDRGGDWQLQLGGAFGGQAPTTPDAPPAAPEFFDPGRTPETPSQVRVVPVPFGAGGGMLLLGVTAGPLDQEVARIRQALVLRLTLGGLVSVMLLFVAFVFLMRVIAKTRKLEAEQQRDQQLAYLGTLASGLAHEIRNPLNAMNINLQLLEEELQTDELPAETVELLRSSRSEVLRLERLVKDFLAFARPQTAKREDLPVGAFAADVVRFMRPLFSEAQVRLELTVEPSAPVVRIAPAQVRQALLNILQNALEASPPGTTVKVVAGATPRGEARIDVVDQGPGIPVEARREIFQVFWSRKPAGSGLGLPIALRAVEVHGGRIEVESAEGAGSTFRIVLPPAMAAPEAIAMRGGPS